ncbi:MAG: dTDP-4-dehydrorhamnose reductase [Acidobacteriota bacterium]
MICREPRNNVACVNQADRIEQLPLILGSRGRLGRALCELIENEHTDDLPDAVFATRDELDVTDTFRLSSEFERIRPTVVVNCAAFARVDDCETYPDLAEAINHAGARTVARAARSVGARVIQISSDLVFDGVQPGPRRPYREEDPPRPLSQYARTKLAGERAVAEENPDHTIIRSSWYFGPWPADRFPEVFLRALQEGRLLRMVADRIGSPTYLTDLSRAIVNIIHTPYRGILHFANRGDPVSRYRVVEALAGRLGIDTSHLIPIPAAQWNEDLAERPAYSPLDPSRYERITGRRSRTWEECLEEYVRGRRR